VSVTLPMDKVRGLWSVVVQLLTDEVRKDLRGVLTDGVSFQID